MSENCTHLFKIIIVGDSGVGKSSLLLRYSEDSYNNKLISTIGVDFKIKTLQINNKAIKLQVWDTAGQERFRTLTAGYYRGAQGIILAYDVTNRDSFVHLSNWITEINSNAPMNVKKILIGTKNDLQEKKEVSSEEGNNLANQWKIPFFETSAKDANNVEGAFLTLTLHILTTIPPSSSSSSSSRSHSRTHSRTHSSIDLLKTFKMKNNNSCSSCNR